MAKTCKRCKKTKPVDAFYLVKKGGTRRSVYCKDCSRASVKKWQRENPDKVKDQCKKADLKRLYGLTVDQRDKLLFKQGGICPICKSAVSKPNVDHCHKTGKIRGILCNKCNLLLGLLGDSPKMAHAAVDYIKYADTSLVVPSPPPTERKLLVTGATGLVGSALRQIVPPNTVLLEGRSECDLLRWSNVDELFSEHRPTHVIHLAAKVGGVKANIAHPATFFLENVTMNTHVIEACKLYKVQRALFFLSTCVFPDPCPLPLKPESLHAGPPHPSNYGYAFAKRMLAVQCQSYNQEYGTNFTPVIPCNIYGEHDNFNLENSHVAPALIRKFWEAKIKGEPVTVWGSGKPLREFIYSHDVARLLLDLLYNYTLNDPIILSTGVETSVRELVETIAKAVDFKGDIMWDCTKPEGQYRKPSDNTPLKALFPKFEFTDLERGIFKTVRWFSENYPNIRK